MNYNAPRHGSEQLRTSLMTPLPGFYQGRIRTVFLILLAASFLSVVLWKSQRAHAATFTSVQDGSWNNPDTWGGISTPSGTDTVIISNGTTVTMMGNQRSGDLTVNGTLDLTGDALSFGGKTFSNNGIVTSATPASELR